MNYTLLLIGRDDLPLNEVFLLDRVQKKKTLEPEDVRRLRALKLIEGRVPNLYVSAKARSGVGHEEAFADSGDEGGYRDLVVDYLAIHNGAGRKDLDELLFGRLPGGLDARQKASKVKNLLQSMRREGIIDRTGPKSAPIWRLKSSN